MHLVSGDASLAIFIKPDPATAVEVSGTGSVRAGTAAEVNSRGSVGDRDSRSDRDRGRHREFHIR